MGGSVGAEFGPTSPFPPVPIRLVVACLAPNGHQEPLAGPQERESPAMATGLFLTFYLQHRPIAREGGIRIPGTSCEAQRLPRASPGCPGAVVGRALIPFCPVRTLERYNREATTIAVASNQTSRRGTRGIPIWSPRSPGWLPSPAAPARATSSNRSLPTCIFPRVVYACAPAPLHVTRTDELAFPMSEMSVRSAQGSRCGYMYKRPTPRRYRRSPECLRGLRQAAEAVTA